MNNSQPNIESDHTGVSESPYIMRGNITSIMNKGLAKRYRAEKRFRLIGLSAVFISLFFLFLLFFSIASDGYTAFFQNYVKLDIVFDPELLPKDGLPQANYAALIKRSLAKEFPDVKKRRQKKDLNKIVSSGAKYQLREMVMANPDLIGKTQPVWVSVDDEVDMYLKGHLDFEHGKFVTKQRKQKIWIKALKRQHRIESKFNMTFFSAGDSREPEQAGILGALTGSMLTLVVTLFLSFPIGICAAIYLEEFAPKNKLTDIIEVNINNLAAVPSIVFGLLGLAVFLNFFGLPRSAPIVGGLVLTLMTLPTIIISSRVSIQSVPPSIRDAALAVGASRAQMVFHHVLPLALPGMLTGTIIGMARALGETAPLLMIGMVAFIVDIPKSFSDAATALPVQIFLWADSPERAFVERTSAAILVLLVFLIAMNATAVILRKRFEKRW